MSIKNNLIHLLFEFQSEKMNWKKIFTISSSCLYIILGSLLFYNYRIDILCGYENPCLRFCSTDTEKYSDKELFDSLLENNITRWYDNEFDDVRIYRGLPECSGNVITIKTFEEIYPNPDYSNFYFYSGNYRIYQVGYSKKIKIYIFKQFVFK